MRTIKFRAWSSGKMVYQNNALSKMSRFWRIIEQAKEHGEEVVIMQFTGLHGKNGKEIYEGDIVKPSFRDGNWFYRIISFEKGMFGYRDKTNSWCIMGIKQGNKPDNKQYEVIGNIYQNTELLTPQH